MTADPVTRHIVNNRSLTLIPMVHKVNCVHSILANWARLGDDGHHMDHHGKTGHKKNAAPKDGVFKALQRRA